MRRAPLDACLAGIVKRTGVKGREGRTRFGVAMRDEHGGVDDVIDGTEGRGIAERNERDESEEKWEPT